MSGGPNIFIGCGGSGINTLIRLNALLNEDAHWRNRLDTDVYYLIVDTDTAAVEHFRRELEDQARGAPQPYVAVVPLAKGVTSLHEVVYRYFRREIPEGGTDRHQKHWWRDRTGNPFIAHQLQVPVSKGAGQVPAISFALAWKNMGIIEDRLNELLREIKVRRRARSTDTAKFTVVASLAGGTGRGCWTLLAFKLRDLVEKSHKIEVTGYLYDASVFEDVIQRYPDWETAMRVNSLTGVSELSAWMRNDANRVPEGLKPYMYNLPNLERPADESADVIKLRLDANPDATRPLTHVNMVFGASDVAVLGTSRQYQEMVGTALYASTTLSHLDSVGSNHPNSMFRGTGAATYEVNATRLRKYFETRLHTRVLQRLTQSDSDSVEGNAADMLSDLGLLLKTDSSHLEPYRSDEGGDLIQRSLYHLDRARQGAMDYLKEALDEDDPQPVKEAIEACCVEATDVVDTAVNKALEGIFGKPASGSRPTDALLAKLEAALESRLTGVASARAIEEFVSESQTRLRATIDGLPSESAFKGWRDAPLAIWDTARKREYLGLVGEHFNHHEREQIEESVRRGVWAHNYPALRKKLQSIYNELHTPLNKWRKSAEAMLKRVGSVREEWKRDLERVAGLSVGGDAFRALFTNAAEPWKALPTKFSEETFYRRELRPVMTQADVSALLDGVIDASAGQSSINDVLYGAMFDEDRSLDSDDASRARRFEEDVKNALATTFRLPEHFMHEHFSVRAAINGLRNAWEAALNKASGDRDRFAELSERFTQFFGVTPEARGNGEYRLPDTREFLLQMGASLASTCKAYWTARHVTTAGPGQDPNEPVQNPKESMSENVTLFLPDVGEHLTQEQANSAMKRLLPDREPSIDVVVGAEAKTLNPFLILAHAVGSTSQLEDIRSLDYYQDHTVKAWMERAEDPFGESWFSTDGRQKGLGFVDPEYVRDPTLSALRWKPWAPETTADSGVREMALDIMLYAFFEPGQVLDEQLGAVGWSLPVLKETYKKRIDFQRMAYREPAVEWKRAQTTVDDPRMWRTRDRAAVGLSRLFKVLQGEDDGAARENRRFHEWASALKAEADVFWGELALHYGFSKGSKRHGELLTQLRDQVSERLGRCERNSDDEAVCEAMLQRIEAHLRA